MVVAKIEAIDLDKPWYYTACNFCKRKMVRQGNGFEGNVQHLQHSPIYNCKTCNKYFEHAIHCGFFSYYLVVRVSDDSKGEAKFLLFNNIAERLIRRPAFELVQEAAQENPHFLPQSLTDLIRRKLLFKITIETYGQQEQNSAYVVDLVIDDADIIQQFDPHVIFKIRSNPVSTDTGNKPQKKKKNSTNDKENTPMGNITQNSSITNVSPLPSINPFRTPFQNVTNQVFRPIIPRPSESNPSKIVENTSTHTVPLSCVFQSFKDGLTHQARAARKEILNNKRTIGLTTSNRGPYYSTQSSPTLANLSGSGINMHQSSTIGNQEISRSTSISLRKRKTLGSPPSVNSKTRQKEARQGPNMTRQTNPTLPAVSVADAPPEGNFLDIFNPTQSPFQQTKTNEFIPPARFIVEDHPEAYNDRYEMESESENENEDEDNQTYTTYPAGESLINPSPQHIPQQTNNTIFSHTCYYDDGDPGWNCTFCQAYMWYGEKIGKRRRSSNPVFTMCCKRDHSINNGRGPFVFRMSGENYHRIGDIVPEPGQASKFSQLYIIDTLNEIKNRLDAYAGSDRAAAKKLREPLVLLLKNMLDQCNPHVKAFRSARDRFDVEGSTGYRMRLIESRQSDGRTHNLPTANEVAALIPGDFVLNMETRDIVLESTSGKLQRISELHPAYLPLQYPLLFPYGEDGFRLNIPIGFEESTARKRKNVTMREYFAFRILERRWEAPTITRSGRLFHQFLVDAYAMIESSRLRYLWLNQKNLRSSGYAAIQKAATRAGAKMAEQGSRIFIPATFTGEKRPEILCRVFKMKLDNLIGELTKKNGSLFGPVAAVMYTIEFQKRGMPHTHILVFMEKGSKFPTADDIDKIISAEIPDKTVDPDLYVIVGDCMMHGPCGAAKKDNVCMVNSKCSKMFLKPLNIRTSIDANGFPAYMRRIDGRFIEKNGIRLDNGFVVPYNRDLMLPYRAHVNVE
ncbi:unnamed protein product [Brassica oleracea]